MKSQLRFIFSCVLMIFLVSCGGQKGGGGVNPPEPDPNPNPSGDELPKSLVYKKKDDEVVVKEVKPNGEVVFDANAPGERIPKKGEVIISGVTDAAPQGFLYRVVDTRKEGDKIIAITEEASLSDVIENCDENISIPNDQIIVNRIVGPNGEEIPYAETRAGKDGTSIGAFDMKMGVQVDLSNGFGKISKENIRVIGFKTLDELNKVNKKSSKQVLELYLRFKSQPSLNFILQMSERKIQKIGIEAQYDLSVQVDAKYAFSAKSTAIGEIELFTIKLSPITLFIGTVPLVITPEIKVNAIAKTDEKFEVRAVVHLLDAKIKTNATMLWHREIPEGLNSHWQCEFSSSESLQSPLFGIPEGDENTTLTSDNVDLAFEGSLKNGIDVSTIAGLYNSNKHFNAQMGLFLYVEGRGELNVLKLFESLDGLGIKFFAGMDFTPRMKVPYVNDSYLDYSFTLFRKEIAHLMLTQEFGGLNIRTSEDNVIVSSELNTSFLKFTILPTRDIGFAISKGMSVEDTQAWEYYSAYEYFDAHKDDFLPFSIESKIPLKSLDPGNTYYIRPYLKVGSIQAPMLLFRKAKAVKINSSGSVGNIEDVPGYNF